MFFTIKQAYRKFYKQVRFNWSAKNHPLFIGFYTYFYRPSKGSLNDFLDSYSKEKTGDFQVIQIGANDGITHDPIHKFIKRDHWKGVLLEPQAFVFETYLQKIYAKNKGIHLLCAAIGEKDGETTLYQIGFSTMRWATGLASFNKKVVEKAFDSGLVQDRCKKYQISIPESAAERIIASKVAVISPATLIERYGLSQIDLLQIDTEGFDYQVIRMFDIAKTKPKAIIFENVHLSEEDIRLCKQLLEDNAYRCKDFGSNTLAMKTPLGQFERFFQ